MSEMIEKVARALLAAHDHTTNDGSAGGFHTMTPDWQETYLNMARAAIEAMMEPNNKMLHEAAKAMSPGRRPTPDRVSVNEKHKIRYQAMIREALK